MRGREGERRGGRGGEGERRGGRCGTIGDDKLVEKGWRRRKYLGKREAR